MKAIAVIDLSNGTLTIYDVPEHYDSEEIEEFLRSYHHMSNCSWGVFNGTITDRRGEDLNDK